MLDNLSGLKILLKILKLLLTPTTHDSSPFRGLFCMATKNRAEIKTSYNYNPLAPYTAKDLKNSGV
jgi:hypothetical protein